MIYRASQYISISVAIVLTDDLQYISFGLLTVTNKQGVGRRWLTYSKGARGLFLFPCFQLSDLFSNLFFHSVAYKIMPSLDYNIFTQSGEHNWIGNWHNNEMKMMKVSHQQTLGILVEAIVSIESCRLHRYLVAKL